MGESKVDLAIRVVCMAMLDMDMVDLLMTIIPVLEDRQRTVIYPDQVQLEDWVDMIPNNSNPKIPEGTEAAVVVATTTTNTNNTMLSSNIINTADMEVNHMVWAIMVITLTNAVDIRICKIHIRCNSNNSKALETMREVASKVTISTRGRRTIEVVGSISFSNPDRRL